MTGDRLTSLIEASDLAGLIRHVDVLCRDRSWAGLIELRDRCYEAVERGKQVWAAAQFAEYRLALEAPGPEAGAVVTDGAGRFTLGPLWEVAASTHSWEELGLHVASPTQRALVAHERVLRGDELAGYDGPEVLEVPLSVARWEPRYPLAVYRGDGAAFPEPEAVPLAWTELGPPGEVIDDELSCEALHQLAAAWVDGSNGRVEEVAVAGDARAAIRALGPKRVRIGPMSLARALAGMAWTGASGGAHGRRRGTPAGRAAAWWALAVLAGVEDDWPVSGAELAAATGALRFYAWDPGDLVSGWAFHLAVEYPGEGLAWAISAVDAV